MTVPHPEQPQNDEPELVMVVTTDLYPYVNNAMVHPDWQVDQIIASIQNNGGFLDPIEIDEANGILAGHGRWEAAKRLELGTVPCIRHSHLTDIQKRAYIIANNQIAWNAQVDDDLLAKELQQLVDEGVTIQSVGISDERLSELLQHSTGSDGDSNDEQKSKGPRTQFTHTCPECGASWSD